MSRKKGDNLSKIRLAEKYRDPNAHVYWMTGVPERIKIQQREARESRAMEQAELERAPEPGDGLAG